MPGLSIARIIDVCSGHTAAPPRPPVAGSMDVLVNNMPVIRAGDVWAPHGSPPHTGVGLTGSLTVLVNGLPVMRTGDPISCGSVVGVGSQDTFCG
jgi:uncharacterized Zn-binding protein involved in type VI secretion